MANSPFLHLLFMRSSTKEHNLKLIQGWFGEIVGQLSCLGITRFYQFKNIHTTLLKHKASCGDNPFQYTYPDNEITVKLHKILAKIKHAFSKEPSFITIEHFCYPQESNFNPKFSIWLWVVPYFHGFPISSTEHCSTSLLLWCQIYFCSYNYSSAQPNSSCPSVIAETLLHFCYP